MTGIKYDNEKPMMDLLPMASLTEVAKVLTAGAKKYARDNWRQGFTYSRLQAAMLRHYTAFSEGENFDDETKLPHLAHMACCVLFLLEHQLKGYGVDDRYTTPSKETTEQAETETHVVNLSNEALQEVLSKLESLKAPSRLELLKDKQGQGLSSYLNPKEKEMSTDVVAVSKAKEMLKIALGDVKWNT